MNMKRLSLWLAALAALALIAGATVLAARRADRQLRADLRQQTRMLAMALNPQWVAALSGAATDLALPEYQQIKTQLALIRLSNPNCRFLYLMSRRPDGAIVFHVDSEPAESKDCSPPGQTYDEAPRVLHGVFATGQDAVHGPYTDRWGTWVSAFVPLPNPHARVRTVLGMDVNAARWLRTVASLATVPIALATVAVLFTLFTTLLHQSRREIRARNVALRKSELSFRSQFVANSSAMLLVDPAAGTLLDANTVALRFYGYPSERLLAMTVFDINTRPEAEVRRAMASVAQEQGGRFEFQHRLADGSIRDVEVASSIVQFNGRSVLHSIIRDITGHKQAEKQIQALLAESNQRREALLGILEDQNRAEADLKRLALAIEHAAEAIVVTDAQGLIQYVNPAFEAVTGYTRDEVIGQNPRILKSGQQNAAFYEDLWATLIRGDTWKGRFVNRKKDGTLYTEEATLSTVRNAAGQIVNYVAVKRDISEHLALQAQLIQAQKLESIGTLASGVAHEINNPIMGIMGYAQLIAERTEPDGLVAEYAAEVSKEAERVAVIVRNLLSFARNEKPTRSLTPLQDIVEDTLSLVRTVMRHDQVTLEVDVASDLPGILCRSQQIRQVIMNLLTNARDALNQKYPKHDANKKILISARVISDFGIRMSDLGKAATAVTSPSDIRNRKSEIGWVRITIEDHGPGIPEDLRERVFDPFFSTKTRDKGTGLGLSISHGIVKDHGGRLSVESDVGRWTRFHIDLPVE